MSHFAFERSVAGRCPLAIHIAGVVAACGCTPHQADDRTGRRGRLRRVTDFTVPDGDAATLLAFIEKLANPQQQFTSDAELQKYLEHVSPAISAAADKVLAGEATDRQMIDAIEWKIESLRIRQKLGDADADKADR